jgi:hypothetical protein
MANSGSTLGRLNLGSASLGSTAGVSGVESSFPADAFVQPYFLLDAEISAETFFSADAIVKASPSGSFTAEAFVQPFFTADAEIAAAPAGGVGGDATLGWFVLGTTSLGALGAEDYESFTADAFITTPTHGWLHLDAFIQPRFFLDAVLEDTFESSTTVDAFVQPYFHAGAFIQPFFTADAWLAGAIDIDAVLLKTWTPSFSVDAEKIHGGDFTLDAIVLRQWTGELHADLFDRTESGTWGTPLTGAYHSYTNETLFSADGDVGHASDEVWESYGGHPTVYVADGAPADRNILIRANLEPPVSSGYNCYFYIRGTSTYIRYNQPGYSGNDYAYLYVNGTQRDSRGWNGHNGEMWVKVEADGTTVRAKIWETTDSEPSSWDLEYTGGTVDGGSPGFFSDGVPAFTYGANGEPFDQRFYAWHVWDPDRLFTVDAAIVDATVEGSFTADAQVGPWFPAQAFIQPYFLLDAAYIIGTRTLGEILVRSIITLGDGPGSLTLDAVLTERVSFTADAYVGTLQTDSLTLDAFVRGNPSASTTLDASIHQPLFLVNAAIITTITHPESYFVVRAELTTQRQVETSATMDAWVEAFYGEQFTIDAVLTSYTKTGTFGADADIAGTAEERGTSTLDAFLQLEGEQALFRVEAVVAQLQPAFIDAFIAGTFTLDATYGYLAGSGSFTLDGWLDGTPTGSLTMDAVVADAGGDYRGLHADAIVLGTVERPGLFIIEVLAHITGAQTGSFTVGSVIEKGGSFALDAWFYQPLLLDAYIEGTNVVVYPPAQDGDDGVTSGTAQSGTDGVAVTGTTFSSASADFTGLEGATIIIDGDVYTIVSVSNSTTVVISGGTISGTGLTWSIPTLSDPEASFSDDDIGSTIVIEGIVFTIIDVVDENTVIVGGGDEWPYANGGISWEVPSGDATDPVGDSAPITRSFQVLIERSRPDREQWTDITGDVIWRTARFTQSARVGAGTFEMTLKGVFPENIGGEEIRVSIDGFRVFGGYVTDVERHYAFEDDYSVPLVTLKGTDYNTLLDRLLIYNAEWDEKKEGSGPYRTWKAFAQGTSDRTIITTVARRFMSDPALMGLDMTTNVDELETPAPTTSFQMESGMSLRNLLTEISRITEGVWWISPYKALHYHSRTNVTAPYPVTDTAGGIACRGLSLSSSLSVMANDVFVWGTQAFMDTGDSDIIYSRQTADQDWDVEWWTAKLDGVQTKIDNIRQTPYDERTLKQRTTLAALRETKEKYERYLANAEATTEVGSLATYRRWQYGEYRNDIYQQNKVDRRARAIMQRYSEPVVKGKATVFEPGFQAGQVVTVVSATHDVADDIVIRQSELSFVVSKEPVDDVYYAVPTYTLSLGLDPEEPWNIYQFLPFPDMDDWNLHFNFPRIHIPDIDEGTDFPDLYLDTFEREYASTTDLGPTTSERDEYRPWEET